MAKNAVTIKEGEAFAHRELWSCAKAQFKHARSLKKGGKYFDMAAVLMAYLAYEAYLNLVGNRLDPSAWSNEKQFFNKQDYYGIEGKLKRIREVSGNFDVDFGRRPYQTIKILGKLRTEMVHAKVYQFSETIKHHEDHEPDWWPNDAFPSINPDNAEKAMHDVEQFIEYIHENVKQYVDDVWFKGEALKGPSSYVSRSTSLKS